MCEETSNCNDIANPKKKIVQVTEIELNENTDKDTQSHYNNLATLILSLSTLNITVAEKINMPDWLYQIVGVSSLAASTLLVFHVCKTEVVNLVRWIVAKINKINN